MENFTPEELALLTPEDMALSGTDVVLKLNIGKVTLPDDLEFVDYQPGLRTGVQICPLFDCTKIDPRGSDAALIRYLPDAFTPRHLHIGHEMVLVLDGDYIENGISYEPGTLIVRAPGTTHYMQSKNGCIILASRDIPVKQLT